MEEIICYLLAVNIVTFLLYGIDKYKAKKGKWRISEATLLTMAAIGGSIGAWAGMRLWHHKTMEQASASGTREALMERRAAPYPYSKMCELCELCELLERKIPPLLRWD